MAAERPYSLADGRAIRRSHARGPAACNIGKIYVPRRLLKPSDRRYISIAVRIMLPYYAYKLGMCSNSSGRLLCLAYEKDDFSLCKPHRLRHFDDYSKDSCAGPYSNGYSLGV